MLGSEKGGHEKTVGGKDELAEGRQEKRKHAKTREELGAHGRKGQEKENHVVWTSGMDGRRKITNRCFTWTCGGQEKQSKAKEDLDGQCQGRPEGDKH